MYGLDDSMSFNDMVKKQRNKSIKKECSLNDIWMVVCSDSNFLNSIEQVFRENPQSVVFEGCTSDELYDKLEEISDICDWIHDHIILKI